MERNLKEIRAKENLRVIIFNSRRLFSSDLEPELLSDKAAKEILGEVNAKVADLVHVIDERENSLETLLYIMKFASVLI